METPVVKALEEGASELLLRSLSAVLDSDSKYQGQDDPDLNDFLECIVQQQELHGTLVLDLMRATQLARGCEHESRRRFVSLKLEQLCARDGLSKIAIHSEASRAEIVDLVAVLRAPFNWKLPMRYAKKLRKRLLYRQFKGLSFLFRFPASQTKQSDKRAKLDWSEEILLEEYRILSLEAGIRLMQDLAAQPSEADYRARALELFSKLLQRLIKEGKISAVLHLLDVADETACFSTDGKELDLALEPFRAPAFLRSLLPVLSSVQGTDLARFLARLGKAIVPMLLKESAHHPTPQLQRVLEQIVSADPEAIYSCLKEADLRSRDHAFNILINSGQELPLSCLQEFASSKSPWLRSRAVELLRAQENDGMNAEIALSRLESRDAGRRIDGLRRMRGLRGEGYFETLRDWFARHQRDMGFAERREAFMSIALVGGEDSLDFLLHRAKGDPTRHTRVADIENRICAILALSKLSSPQSIAVLTDLCQSEDQTVHNAAKEALSSRRP